MNSSSAGRRTLGPVITHGQRSEYTGTTLRDHLGLGRPELDDHVLIAVDPIAANTKTPLRADARRNRERIIASARELFALRGEQAHMGDIAKHAGVGQGTLYRHFPDKEALLTEVIRTRFDEFYEIASRAEEMKDPFEAVETALHTTLIAIQGDTGLQFEIMRSRGLHWEGIDEQKAAFAATIIRILKRAQTAGAVRSDLNSLQAWDCPKDAGPPVTVFPSPGRQASVPFVGFAEAFVLGPLRKAGVQTQRTRLAVKKPND
jgi:AcrR family transcriptional regulator